MMHPTSGHGKSRTENPERFSNPGVEQMRDRSKTDRVTVEAWAHLPLELAHRHEHRNYFEKVWD